MDDRNLDGAKSAAEGLVDKLDPRDTITAKAGDAKSSLKEGFQSFTQDLSQDLSGDEDDIVAEVHEQDEQLRLADEDERLPWLESDDDYDDDGVDTGRIAMVALLGLAAVLAIVGLIYWFTRPTTDEALLAEGATIEAVDGEFRDRPDDAGGSDVDGTGDVSFAVGEGEESEAQMGEENGASEGANNASANNASVDLRQSDVDGSASGSTGASGNNAGNSGTESSGSVAAGTAVQVAAYSSRSRAEEGWGELAGRFSALNGLNHRVVSGQVDGATVYRLQAVTGSSDAASRVCSAIKSQGGDCQVK